MGFEAHFRRNRVRQGEADAFLEELMGEGELRAWRGSDVFWGREAEWEEEDWEADWNEEDWDAQENFAGEATVGQLRIAGRQQVVVTTGSTLFTGATLDEALLNAVGRTTGHTVILGNAVGGTRFTVLAWGPPASLAGPLRVEFDGPGVAALLTNGGARVYLPADPLATAPAARLAWVHVPGINQFLRLPTAQRDAQRQAWATRVHELGLANPSGGRRFTRAQVNALSSPVLRLLLAQNGAHAYRVRRVMRSGTDRGGVVSGLTRPVLPTPLSEPRIYLRVISRVEGKMESINAWDHRAGISLGPIQINAQRGALLRFLHKVWTEDRTLFTATFGTDWRMRVTGGVPQLSVRVGGRPVWLRGGGAAADVQRVYAYFQSGDPARAALSQIDPNHRRTLARRFANLVAWPHVQDLLEETTTWWLQPGLDRIHAAGIPAFNPARPDRDLFVLKALLMSLFVRFSGCLAPMLTALGRYRTVADKLANWERALAAMGGACSASGTAAQRRRNDNLRERLGRQEGHARTVFAEIQALRAARPAATAGTAAPAATPTARSEAIGMGPRAAAELFDRAAAGDAASAEASGLEVITGPGELVPQEIPEGAFAVTRAVGEGRFAVARALHRVGPGTFEIEGLHGPLEIRGGERLEEDRMLLAPISSEIVTRCGFFGAGHATEQQVRDAVRAAAQTEWTAWHTNTGRPQDESVAALFGRLVSYYLHLIPQVRPETLTHMATRATNGTVAFGAIPRRGAGAAVVNRWAQRNRSQLLTGAPHATIPANLNTRVESAIKRARQAHHDSGGHSAWSAAWITACVRGAAIGLRLERSVSGSHVGRDLLLLVSALGRHSEYTFEAHRRATATPPRLGTFHAFDPATRAPQVGDIIVQDRQARGRSNPLTFARIARLARGRALHGDIVVSVARDNVVTIGGNVRDSCRQRRYPLDANGRLVMVRNQLYTQETDTGALPNTPVTTRQRLHPRSTLRVFALLSPVQECVAVPGQPVPGGVLV